MEDFSKIREEQNKKMSFEEYNNSKDKVKEKKFGKAMKSMLLYPVKFVGAIFGVTEKSILDSSRNSGHGHAGAHHHHSSNNFKQSYRVDPPPQRSHEDWVRDEMAREAYMKMVDGKGDHDCGHEH